MKALSYITLAGLLCLSISACQNGSKEPASPSTTQVDNAAPNAKAETETSIIVPKIEVDANDLETVQQKLASLKSHPISTINWPAEYPSKPEASFSIAHNGDNILLQYQVHENEILAAVTEDNGEVWTDSAVEFFLAFDDTFYYNAEFNCIGTALLGYKNADGSIFESASPQVMKSIKRLASLGSQKRDKEQGDFHWTLTLVIPSTAYWKNNIQAFDGLKARGNFYKCGDNLTVPHFVSWTKIDTPQPSFHQPSFFGTIIFE